MKAVGHLRLGEKLIRGQAFWQERGLALTINEHIGVPNFFFQLGTPSLGLAQLGSSFVGRDQMLFCVCWVDKTIVTHSDNSGQALLSPRRVDGAGAFARVRERRERTNSMHRKSNREAFVATLAVYTYYKVQSLLSLGARQNKLLFARVGRGNASCWESGVFLAKASTVAGQWGQKMWTPHLWCPAVAGSGWQKSSVNEVQIQYKNKNKKPECVCGESSPHSKYNESIHYFSLKSFLIFFGLHHCFLFFSFSFTCVF